MLVDLLAGGPLDESAQTFDLFTGDHLTGPDGRRTASTPHAVVAGLEPPRYCGVCGRRMPVQIRPDGWWARCSRHGIVDSADLDMR